jgi:glycosyltransferase 2 family protein
MKRALQLALGIAVSAVAVWFSMRGVRFPEVWAALTGGNVWLRWLILVAVMALTLGSFWVRALRWRSLLSGGGAMPLGSLFSATMIGFMTNNLLPFRLGEFIRPWVLARRERCSASMALATIVVERVVDMLALLAILGITLFVHPIRAGSKAAEIMRAGATSLIVLTLALTALLIALERMPGLSRRLIHGLGERLPAGHRDRVVRALDHFLEGLGLFRDLPRLLWVSLLSLILFSCFGVALQLSLIAFGIQLPWYAGFLLLVITAFAIMAPAAPGYIGTMNVACVAGLALFGVKDDAGVISFSWFYWIAQWLPVTAVGLVYAQREGLSLRSLNRVGEGAE